MGTRTVECANCGRVLDEPRDTPAEDRKPCPDCGSTGRSFVVSLTAEIRAGAAVSVELVKIPAPEPPPKRAVELEEIGFKLTWYRYPDGLLFVQVHNDKGELIDAGGGDNPDDCLLGIAEQLLPPEKPKGKGP